MWHSAICRVTTLHYDMWHPLRLMLFIQQQKRVMIKITRIVFKNIINSSNQMKKNRERFMALWCWRWDSTSPEPRVLQYVNLVRGWAKNAVTVSIGRPITHTDYDHGIYSMLLEGTPAKRSNTTHQRQWQHVIVFGFHQFDWVSLQCWRQHEYGKFCSPVHMPKLM